MIKYNDKNVLVSRKKITCPRYRLSLGWRHRNVKAINKHYPELMPIHIKKIANTLLICTKKGDGTTEVLISSRDPYLRLTTREFYFLRDHTIEEYVFPESGDAVLIIVN